MKLILHPRGKEGVLEFMVQAYVLKEDLDTMDQHELDALAQSLAEGMIGPRDDGVTCTGVSTS